MLRMITNRSPSPAPRTRGFPLPLWRGVNGIANHSRTGSPCPVLQQEARVFTPLSNGEGLGVGLIVVRGLRAPYSSNQHVLYPQAPTLF